MRLPRRLLPISLAVALLAGGATARAAGWHSAQPPPPASSTGQPGVQAPVPLGHIGDIEFWAPNRGLLITAGNEAVPAGLYYYNGVSWRELSSVCGGGDGRIAWAGPEDFWTISDQQAGQQLGAEASLSVGRDRSLCHFQEGRVVASYAEPIGVAGSYQSMDAAVCSGPDNCWFGGERLPGGANSGAFHLHWNGQALSVVPSLETSEPQIEDPARDVSGIAYYKGRFYESVQVQQDDPVSAGESASQPYLLHRIAEGSSKPFTPLIPEGPPIQPPPATGPLREAFSYGPEGVQPWQLSAFRLSGDSAGLWAVAGPVGPSSPARVTALVLQSGQFQQLKLDDPEGALAGAQIAGVAAEPGSEDAWVSIDPSGEGQSSTAVARVARIHANGEVDPQDVLPEAGEGLAHKGAAGTISCPAQGDCWMASTQGWLFHLGGNQTEDDDPAFQSLITYRPPDASIPFVAPETFPEDDSGDNPPPVPPPPASELVATQPPRAREPLFSRVKVKLIGSATLALSFTLTTKSHVRLVALRHKHEVAHTKRYVLVHGRHTLDLHLNAHAWPTKLDLQVKAIGAVPLLPARSEGGEPAAGGPVVVGTFFRVLNRSLSTPALLP